MNGELALRDPIGKGPMGDYTRAVLNGKEVAVKTLINQKLKEDDMLMLLADSSLMSKINHPNLLKFYGVCLDEDRIYIFSKTIFFYFILVYFDHNFRFVYCFRVYVERKLEGIIGRQ